MIANMNIKMSNTFDTEKDDIKTLMDKNSSTKELGMFEKIITSDISTQSDNFKKKLDEKRRKSSKNEQQMFLDNENHFKVLLLTLIIDYFK